MVDKDFQTQVDEWLDGLRDVFLTMKDNPEEMATVAASMVGLCLLIYPDLKDEISLMLLKTIQMKNTAAENRAS